MKISLSDFEGLLEGCRRYEGYLAARCIFHDDQHPSLMIYEDDRFFRCLACGTTGTFDYLYEVLRGRGPKQPRGQAVRWNLPSLGIERKEIEGIAVAAHRALIEFPDALDWYFRTRGVEGRILPCKLGWMSGWGTIPIHDQRGAFEGLVLRAGSHIERANGLRFHQPKGQKPLLYVPDWPLLDRSDTLVVVFGLFDALSLSEARYAVCTTTGGKDGFNPEWLDFWRKKIVVIPDLGEEETAMKLVGKLDWRGFVYKFPYEGDEKDMNDCLVKRPNDLVKILSSVL